MTSLVFAVGLFKFALSVVLAVVVVFVTCKIFIKANTDFDEMEEIKKGNSAVGLLVTALLVASANIIYQGLTPILNLIGVQFTTAALPWRQVALYGLGQLLLAFVLAVAAMSFSLRLFGRLTRPALRAGVELEHGNLAVGILLSGVVLVVSLYIGDGVNALSKAIIPQAPVVGFQIMR